MKSIVVKHFSEIVNDHWKTDYKTHNVYLGNGLKKRFKNKKDSEKFLVAASQFHAF